MSLGSGEGNFDARVGRKRHRDERQSGAPDEIRAHGKKDRVRWCKGQVGVEHDYSALIPWRRGYGLIHACARCGRRRFPIVWKEAERG